MNIITGSNPQFQYYSTPLDHNPVFTTHPISMQKEMLEYLETELSTKEPGAIIGIENNPDFYDANESLNPILDLFTKYKMGLFLMTSSQKIINDIDALVQFSKKNPLMIAIPAAVVQSDSDLFGPSLQYDNAHKILQKLKSNQIPAGLVIKPIIPFINDQLKPFITMLRRSIEIGVDFIYPTFSIKFDSRKLKAFYDKIDQESPELLVRYLDLYGMKHAWESPNMSVLKKNFVIECRKHKVLYAMKDIINLYKPDLNIQMKLF